MVESRTAEAPLLNSVLHPSDFSATSEDAFAHALALVLAHGAEFTILHTGEARNDWRNFPAVRATLERWGVLEAGSPRSAVFEQLAVRVKKVMLKSHRPLESILEYLRQHPMDLIVLATAGRTGLPRWLHPSMAERIAQRSATQTLFIPDHARGFVSRQDGKLSIQRILVPVDHRPGPLPAVACTARLAGTLAAPVEIILLHIGDSLQLPASLLPGIAGCTWRQEHRRGDVVDTLLATAREYQVDLIAMTTAGAEGVLDALRGSVTQQLLRQAPCPLLAIPGS